jgi:K319L-like, PKD domain
MITTAVIKSYFLVIVALASVAGSAIAAPYISNFANVGSSSSSSSEPSSLIPDASAQSVPYRVDHHLKIKEKVGDPVRIEENINDGEQHCEMSCKYIEYKPGSRGRAGLAFLTDAPVDLSGAQKVHFFLMGENGGETVKVKIAGKNPQTGNANVPSGPPQTGNANVTAGPPQQVDDLFNEKFGLSTDVITLANDWQRYEVPLEGVDLKNIVAPFGIELLKGKGSATQVVYLKYVVYGDEPVDERFLLPANATTANATTANATTANATTANATTANATTANATEVDNNTTDNETSTFPNNTVTNPVEEQFGNATNNTSVEGQDNENLAPTALLRVDNLVAHPGDRIILDGSLSNDPDGDQITYQWSQSDGPDADIISADTAMPTVTIPTLDQSDQITVDLVVSDGQVESNRASVVIDVQFIEEIEDTIEQNVLPDDDTEVEGWTDDTCGGDSAAVECLTDNSDSTFVSSDTPSETTDMMFSFQDPSSIGINSTNQIAYVTAQITAKKIGASGFTSLVVDNPGENEHYNTPSISIASDSFEDYSFTWSNNPVTGAPWTADSLNSLIAGYRYTAGQGSVQISEFTLIIASLVSQEAQEPPPPPLASSATDEEPPSEEEEEAAAPPPDGNGDNDSDDEDSTPTNEEEEEPSPDGSEVPADEGPNTEGGEQEDESNTESSENQQEDDPGQE